MTHRLSLLVVVALAFAACKPAAGLDLSGYPGTEDGAKQLLSAARTTDPRALTLALRPTTADYQAVYVDGAAAGMEAGFNGHIWNDPKAVIAPRPENTELVVSKIASDELAAWSPQAVMEFPGGYKRVGPKLRPGLTVYRWKYTKPGELVGQSYDGLIYVNHRWAWFPKPWLVVDGQGT
ncbi:MAG TPA: hypothetical protein VGC42_19120 [Kofleriaceae bacterium]